MPVVYGKIEGRGNGIKTVIPNIYEVATSLHRQPGEVNKFFGTELGAQTTYSADTDRAVVNGAHTDATLQNLIKKYIDIFVLCPNCGLPETDYKIKSECIYHKCAACGAKEMVDMSHKLCTYILAQDKKAKKEAKAKKGKDKDGDGKKAKKKSKDKEQASGSDEDGKKKKSKDKKKKKKEKKDKSPTNGGGGDGNYLEDAIFGTKGDDDFGDENGDAKSVASEGAVDDAGALCKCTCRVNSICFVCAALSLTIFLFCSLV
jgi:translation initiation factor 5